MTTITTPVRHARGFGFSLLFFVAVMLFHAPFSAVAADSSDDIPVAARVILMKVGKLIDAKDYEAAVSVILEFQQKQKKGEKSDRYGYDHAEIYYTLGVCYLLENKTAQAAAVLDKALAKDPRHLSALLNRAKAAYELSDYHRAAECFEATFALDPKKNPEHLYYAAVALLLAKDSAKSITVFERLLAEYPAQFQPAWRENLVHALLDARREKAALPHIRQLVTDFTGDKRKKWQEVLLNEYLHLDMYSEALALATELSAHNPTESAWWRALVHIHLYRNQYKPALTSLVVLSYLEPLKEQEQRLLADLYLQLGVPKKATPVYAEMLRNKPSSRLLSNAVAALQMLGREDEAIRLIDQFKGEKLPSDLLMRKADLLYQVGNFEEAFELYQEIVEEGGKEKKRAIKMAEYAKLQSGGS